MRFLWPQFLWMLVCVPALVAVYFWALRRKKKAAIRYASVSLVASAIGRGPRLRRHIPPLLFLLAITAAILAIARPSAVITLPSEQRTIVLAIDVSLSMRAKDVEPNRIIAAQAAAKAFVEELPADIRVGIVSFAATASIVQKPTSDREELLGAIDRFQLQLGTATGSGVIASLATLFPEEGIDLEAITFGSGSARFGSAPGAARNAPLKPAPKTDKKPFKPVPPGSYESGAIILLSDGRRTTGPDPMEAAKMAADRGVRVYAVGFGTVDGGVTGFQGYATYFRLDEETLKAIADVTRGEYFYAGTAADLKKVYQNLNSKLVLEKKETEITALFSAAASAVGIASGLLSLAWFSRLV